jgi:peptidoglycan/LPS O-acetylase OafA/YrhL
MPELEAVRGIASLIVLGHHCLLGFAPVLHGLVDQPQPWSLFGTPLFAFVNGTGAVVVFFVLSGFVLTYRAIERRDKSLLWIGAIKRWPRLVLPVLIVNVVAGLLAASQLYFNGAASEQLHSTWLGWFYRGNSYSWPPDIIAAAVYEGTVGTFLFGSFYFNSNLWTMYYELFGSMLVFGLAYLFLQLKIGGFVIVALIACAAAIYVTPFSLCFAVGVGLAIVRCRALEWGWMRKPWGAAPVAFLSVLAILLFGYHEHVLGPAPMRFYGFLAPLGERFPYGLQTVLHTIGAVIVLLLAVKYRACLRGPWAELVGRLSFPIYLLQIPLICSLGASVWLVLSPVLGAATASVVSILVTITVTVAAALPLARLDVAWLGVLHRIFAMMPRPAAPPAK